VQAVFIIFGAITIAWGVILFKLLPDVPSKSWFLTEEERLEAIVRIKENMTGIKSNKVQWYQCHEALLDIKLWLLVLIQLAYNIVNGGVQSVGFSRYVRSFYSTQTENSSGQSSLTGWASAS
jgi:hypothetical protein